MERRTDLALEAAEQPVLQETLSDRDVERERFERGNAALTRIHIRSERGERALGKPRGTYITAELPALTDNETELEETCLLYTSRVLFGEHDIERPIGAVFQRCDADYIQNAVRILSLIHI